MIRKEMLYYSTIIGKYFSSMDEAEKEEKIIKKERLKNSEAKEMLKKYRQIRKAYQYRLISIQNSYSKIKLEEENIRKIYEGTLNDLTEKLCKLGIDVSELEIEKETPITKNVKVHIVRKGDKAEDE